MDPRAVHVVLRLGEVVRRAPVAWKGMPDGAQHRRGERRRLIALEAEEECVDRSSHRELRRIISWRFGCRLASSAEALSRPIPLCDDNFLGNLNTYKPSSYPTFTTSSLDSAG